MTRRAADRGASALWRPADILNNAARFKDRWRVADDHDCQVAVNWRAFWLSQGAAAAMAWRRLHHLHFLHWGGSGACQFMYDAMRANGGWLGWRSNSGPHGIRSRRGAGAIVRPMCPAASRPAGPLD
jgi:hypothetical protein